MSEYPELSIVVLCYRSGEQVIPFAEKVTETARILSEDYEIVLVGNYVEGSEDKTKEIVLSLAAGDARMKALAKPKKGMMGWDMMEGMKATRGRYICVIDGDGQFPIESIQACFQKMKEGRYDLVKTYRTKRYDGIYRRLISAVYNIVFSVLFPGLGSRDINSKPKIISRTAYEKMVLTSTDWFIDAEIMINIRRLRLRYFEIPVVFYGMEERASFVRPGAIIEFVKNLVAYRLRESHVRDNE